MALRPLKTPALNFVRSLQDLTAIIYFALAQLADQKRRNLDEMGQEELLSLSDSQSQEIADEQLLYGYLAISAQFLFCVLNLVLFLLRSLLQYQALKTASLSELDRTRLGRQLEESTHAEGSPSSRTGGPLSPIKFMQRRRGHPGGGSYLEMLNLERMNLGAGLGSPPPVEEKTRGSLGKEIQVRLLDQINQRAEKYRSSIIQQVEESLGDLSVQDIILRDLGHYYLEIEKELVRSPFRFILRLREPEELDRLDLEYSLREIATR